MSHHLWFVALAASLTCGCIVDADDYVGVYQAIDKTIAFDVPCSSPPTMHEAVSVDVTYFTLLANRDGQLTQIYCDSADSCPTDVQQVLVVWLTPTSSGFETDTATATLLAGEAGPNPPKRCELAKTHTMIQSEDGALHIDQYRRDVISSDASNCTQERADHLLGDSQDCRRVSDVKAVRIAR